jgi:uncharacterized protein DUF4184
MPYTISHAAVVLPFSRLLARRRLLSAVIIGAMVPDFGLFFPWHVPRFETHTFSALFAFCLPVGLTTYWIFQYLVKTPLLEVLPEGPYARWLPFSSRADIASIRQWLLAAGGILAGAVTHLCWDAFTHENARGVRMIPWLEEPIVEIGNHHVAVVRLLQDGSSLIGLVIVLGFVCYGLRRGHDQPAPMRPLGTAERRAWELTYVLAAVALSVGWFLWARAGEPASQHSRALANGVAVAALRGLASTFLFVSLCLTWRLRALRQASARRSP